MAENETPQEPQDARPTGESPESGAPSPGPEGEALTPPGEPGPASTEGTEPAARETAVPPRQPVAREGAPARPAPARPARPAAAEGSEDGTEPAETVATEPVATTPMARVDERIVERHERVQTGAAEQYTRRRIMRTGFFGTMGLFIAALALQTWNFCWPRGLSGFGGIFTVSADRVPQPGAEPVRVIEGKFWLVNLTPDEGTHGGFGEQGGGGLLALYQRCPHLGCTVPWRGTFSFESKEGWFRCPCHGSTYTKGGVRVFGPAPRPLDTMAISVQGNGTVQVNTGEITLGAPDNPKRAVPYNRT